MDGRYFFVAWSSQLFGYIVILQAVGTQKQIEKVEREANRGTYGAWRREFCKRYREVYFRICQEASQDQKNYLNSTGSEITCHKGCAYCCVQYISISLAHGLIIVDYLYSNPKVMELFFMRYKHWQKSVAGSPALQVLEQYTTFSPAVRRTPQALLDEYARLGVPCPFLVGRACSIYPVRPICCASHVSVSPPENCREGSAALPLISEAVPSQEQLRELALLGESVLSMHQETLPQLIYKLLTEGLPGILSNLELISGTGHS